MSARADRAAVAAEQKTVGRAAFLGGLLAFVALVELSVVGMGHARSLEGDANIQYWVVVALIGGTAAFVTAALARAKARSRIGEAARRAAVVVSGVAVVLFFWECVALGVGATASPFTLIGGLFR